MKQEITQLLESVYGQPVTINNAKTTGGGCINQTQILKLSNGETVFLKYNSSAPENMFQTEAKGLELLRSAKGGPRAPRPLGIESGPKARFFLLEYIEEISAANGYYIRFARALAAMHRVTRKQHGLDHDNFIGKTPQKNSPEKDGIAFFRDRRIRLQQELARKSRRLPPALDQRIDKLCEKLESLLDVSGEAPGLLHGDLWSGNHFPASGQTPCIFDPAVYFGFRETDLAMTELFGRLPQAFYDAYQESFPLNPGYEERKILYNIYHLLNHLNLFGGSYLGSVEQNVRYFTD